MVSGELRAALSEHLEAVATCLQAEIAQGAEVQFELEQHGRRTGARRPALYCYRALSGEFIAERAPVLRRLPTYHRAAVALAEHDGLERYLLSTGVDLEPAAPSARVSAALAALIEEVFAEQTTFELLPERLQRVLARLERCSGEAASEVMLLATLHGLAIAESELPITASLRIVRPDVVTGLPPSALAGRAVAGAPEPASDGGGHLLVMLQAQEEDPQRAVARGREVLGELLRALRLFGDGRIALGRLAWVRVAEGAWHPWTLEPGGSPRGVLLVAADQEDELRAFCNLVCSRAPHGDALAWALRRFELGCERANALEALSDHLLALRALLEPQPHEHEVLAGRLAALCATAHDRDALGVRVEEAIALELAVRAGHAAARAGEEELARELADHLRALLRDVICGHLPADLVALADELADQSSPPGSEHGDERLGVLEDDLALAGEATAVTSERIAVRHEDPAVSSLEEIFSDPRQAEQILDVLI